MLTAVVETARVCVFLLLACLTVKSFRRGSAATEQAARWLTAAFAVLAGVVLAGAVLPGLAGRQGTPGWKLAVCGLLLFPYLLGRFTMSFGAPPTLRRVGLFTGVTVGLILATIALPDLDGVPHRPAAYQLYALCLMAGWTVQSVLSARSLWWAGRDGPAVVRRRMRLLSLGSVMVNAAILLLGSAPPAREPVQLSAQLLGMVSGWLFFVGFAPPAALRAFWRQPDIDLFHAAEGGLVAALDPAAVAAVIVPQAVNLLGASAAFITDEDGRALACHGVTPEGAAAVASGLGAAGDQREAPGARRLVMPLREGWFVVVAGAATPAFGPEEVSLFQALGHSAELGLERADLLARERAGRAALIERERQLAQAQHLARCGSWEWHIDRERVVWSDEMYRIYDVDRAAVDGVPDGASDHGWFRERCHPDDAAALADAVRRCTGSGEPFCLDHRVILSDGRQRWLQSRGEAVRDDTGRVSFLRGTAQDITETKEAQEALAYQALHDSLTGLPNRVLLMDRLEQAAGRAQRTNPLTVLFLDLDHFKVVNDSLGHGAGDELLQTVARRLADVVRPGDTVARFGGDEFVILCENLPGSAEAAALAQRVSDVLALPMIVAGEEVSITASVGVVVADAGWRSPDGLLRDADLAMYEAKERGRARTEPTGAAL